jgi:hypothetical protein
MAGPENLFHDTMNWEEAVSFHGYVGGGEEGLRTVNIFDRVYMTSFPAFPLVDSNFKFDPGVYNGTQCYEAIRKAIIDKCREAGFSVYTHRNSFHKKKRGKRLAQVTFKCDHNKLSTDRLSKIGSQPKQRTARPDTCENRCEFEITVFCAEDQCWYLSSRDETGSKRTQHRGHVQILPTISVTNQSTYKFLTENFAKDAMKAVADDDELQKYLINACNKLVLECEGKKLVSLSAKTELSRSHGRMKRGYEHCSARK